MRSALVIAAAALAALPARAGAGAADSIESLVQALDAAPGDLRLGNRLRQACRAAHETPRCIELFNELVAGHPGVLDLRYNAALAYVDELPGHSILQQGRLSSRSIDHATAVLEARPGDWLALYVRGMNHLYWPLIFRHIDAAIADLERCARIVESAPAGDRKPFHALGYLALGDAWAKKGEPARAREAWQRAAGIDPSSPSPAARLRLAEAEQREFVARVRDLDKPIDTDLDFLWRTR